MPTVPGSFASAVMTPRCERLQGKDARHVDIHLGQEPSQKYAIKTCFFTVHATVYDGPSNFVIFSHIKVLHMNFSFVKFVKVYDTPCFFFVRAAVTKLKIYFCS
jgi:hypothetical protein